MRLSSRRLGLWTGSLFQARAGNQCLIKLSVRTIGDDDSLFVSLCTTDSDGVLACYGTGGVLAYGIAGTWRSISLASCA